MALCCNTVVDKNHACYILNMFIHIFLNVGDFVQFLFYKENCFYPADSAVNEKESGSNSEPVILVQGHLNDFT